MSFRIYSPYNTYNPPSKLTLLQGSPSSSNSWVIQNNTTNLGFRKSAFGQGKWIVISSSDNSKTAQFVTSTDNGTSWTPGSGGDGFYDPDISTGSYNQYADIAFGNNRWVVVGQAGSYTRISSSPDGVIWTKRDTRGGAVSVPQTTSFSGISFDNNQFVAIGRNTGIANAFVSKIFTSPDGDIWTGRPIVLNLTDISNTDVAAAANNWQDVAYGNNVWVAVGRVENGANTKNVLISTDNGLKWKSSYDISKPSNPIDTMSSRNWERIAFGNGIFVAVSSKVGSDCIATSTDGISWTLRTAPTAGSLYSIGYGNGTFIAASYQGPGYEKQRTITSTDGINWKTLSNPVDNQFYGVNYENGVWILNSNNGTNNRIMRLENIVTSGGLVAIKKMKYDI